MPGVTLPQDQGRLLDSLLARVERLERATKPVANTDLRRVGTMASAGEEVWDGSASPQTIPNADFMEFHHDSGATLFDYSGGAASPTALKAGLYLCYASVTIPSMALLTSTGTYTLYLSMPVSSQGQPGFSYLPVHAAAQNVGVYSAIWLEAGDQLLAYFSQETLVDQDAYLSGVATLLV